MVDEAEFMRLYGEGLGNREMARQLGLPHWKVGRELKLRGMLPNVAKGQPPKLLPNGLYECNKCGAEVALEDFPYVQGRADGRRLSYCRKCRRLQSRIDLGADASRYWRDCTRRLHINTRGHECDLPDGYLFDLWERQGGRCFYTDAKLAHKYGEGRTPMSPSVDRVDTTRGYLVGNLVICSTRVNMMKYNATLEEVEEWMPCWYQRIVDAGFIS